jgi:thiol-disulfide isomerase/thioredoxin
MRLRYVALVGLGLLSFGCSSEKPKPFELFSVDGKQTFASDSYRGKVLMLDFWATWCGPCKQLQPTIHDMADTYGDRGLVVLGVSDEAPNLVAEFVKRAPLGYPAVIDRGDRVSREFKVGAYPTIVIFDRDGSVAYSDEGGDTKAIGAALDRLLPAKS